MPARDQRLMLVAALATSATLLVAALAGHAELLSYAAPLFLLAVPLLAGRYVGEERLERMRSGMRPGRRLAHSLAERPPPPLAAS